MKPKRLGLASIERAAATTKRLLTARHRESKRAVYIENVLCLKQTDKAILCEIDGDEKWIPQSCVHDNSEVWQEGDEGTLVITRWIAEKAGLA